MYIDQLKGSRNGTGTRESPFSDIGCLDPWLKEHIDSTQQVLVRVLFAPGTYEGIQITRFPWKLVLEKCADCRDGPVNEESAVILAQPEPLFYAFDCATLTLKGLHFTDPHNASELSSKSFLMSQRCNLVIESCTFSHLKRSSPLITLSSAILSIYSTSMTNISILHHTPEMTDTVAGLIHAIGVVLMRDSHFEQNELVIDFPILPRYEHGGIVLKAGSFRVDLNNSNFIRNILRVKSSTPSPLLSSEDSVELTSPRQNLNSSSKRASGNDYESKVLVRGTIVVDRPQQPVMVNNCYFLENAIEDEGNSIWGGGAAISASEHISIAINNSTFIRNRAEIGNVLHVYGLNWGVGAAKVSQVSLTNVTILDHKCALGGCGVAITSASQPVNVSITGSLFQNCSLEFPWTFQHPTTHSVLRSFTGGAALLVSFPSAEPMQTSLKIVDTIFKDNSIDNLPPLTPGAGVDIALYQVLDVWISGTSFSDSKWSVRYGVIWARMFNSFVMRDLLFQQTSLPKSTYRSSPLVDLQDTISFYGDYHRSVGIYNTSFINCIAGTLIYIADVHHVDIQDVDFIFDPSTYNELRYASLSTITTYRIEGALKMSRVRQSTFGSITVSEARTVDIRDSYFGSLIFGHATSWQVELEQVNKATISNSTFYGNHVDGCLHVGFIILEIYNSSFSGCSVPAPLPGAAIYAEFTALTIASSSFKHCSAESGGAISLLGTASISDSIFYNNTAHANGGAFHSTFGNLTIERTVFQKNTADLGASIYVTGTTSPSDSLERISRKSSAMAGEGVYSAMETPHIVVNSSTFELGYSTSGGALFIQNRVKSIISNASFVLNHADQNGGAIFFGESGAHKLVASRFIENLAGQHDPRTLNGSIPPAVINNLLRSYHYARPKGGMSIHSCGGAVVLPSGSIAISRSEFAKNAAEVQAGALLLGNLARLTSIRDTSFTSNVAGFVGGALSVVSSKAFNVPSCFLQVQNTTFEDNSAMYGGAMEYSPTTGCADSLGTSSIFELVLFRKNDATVSGGAIYSYRPGSYVSYRNTTFENNSAKLSGGTFFLNAPETLELCPPGYCSVTVDWTQTKYRPRWGPYWASSSWTPRTSTNPPFLPATEDHEDLFLGSDSTHYLTTNTRQSASDDPYEPQMTSQVLTLADYELGIAFEDLFNQTVDEDVRISLSSTLTCLKNGFDGASKECPFLSSSETGTDLIYLSLFADASIYRPLTSFDAEIHRASPFESNIPVQLELRLTLVDYDLDAIGHPVLMFGANLTGCPIGSGLSNATDSSFSSCSPCAINSYNLNNDGYCYLCNSFATNNLECEGGIVGYRDNYWVSSKPFSNDLFVQKCLLGYCKQGSCAKHRTGLMCAECETGSFSSFFSACSPTICAKPSVSLFIVASLLLIAATIALHLLIANWAAAAMFWILIAQVSFSLLSAYADWAIPLVSNLLTEFLCGRRMDVIERYYLLTFTPYASLLSLALFWLFLRLLSKIMSLRAAESGTSHLWFAKGGIGSWRRLLMTSTAIIYVCSFWTLGRSIDWIMCSQSVLGNLWQVAPHLRCDSDDFKKSRALFSAFSWPLALLPLAACLLYLIINLPHIRSRILSSVRGAKLFRALNTLFCFTTSNHSVVWAFTDLLLLRLLLPILQSSLAFHASLQASIVCILFMAATGISALYSPHLTLWARYCSTAYLGALAILSIVKLDFGVNPKLPVAITGVNALVLIMLAIGMIFGLPKPSERGEKDLWTSDAEEDSQPLLIN